MTLASCERREMHLLSKTELADYISARISTPVQENTPLQNFLSIFVSIILYKFLSF